MTDRAVRLTDLRPDPEQLEQELAAVRAVLERGAFVLGPEVEAFEAELAASAGTAHAVGVGSGTDALSLGLTALGVGPGDEVIVPAFTAFATVAAVLDAGATPVLADVAADQPHLDLEAALAAVTPRTRAVVLVHLYGIPVDVGAWTEAFVPLDIAVVEDGAQAQGATLPDRRPAGSAGRFGAFSFYPTKNLGALGDGGAVVTDDPATAAAVRIRRNHGVGEQRHVHEQLARNSRLDEVQAAVLRVRLRGLPDQIARRRAISDRYAGALAGRLPYAGHGPRGAPHLAVVRSADPEAVQRRLDGLGIETDRHYPLALPDQPALRHREIAAAAQVPNARAWAASCLSLPLHARLDPEAVDHVVGALVAAESELESRG